MKHFKFENWRIWFLKSRTYYIYHISSRSFILHFRKQEIKILQQQRVFLAWKLYFLGIIEVTSKIWRENDLTKVSVCNLQFGNRRAEHYKSKLFLTWTGAALFLWGQRGEWPTGNKSCSLTAKRGRLWTGEQNIIRTKCFWPQQVQLYFLGDCGVNDHYI